MRPLRYSINVTLDGCCDHRAITADEDLHRHAVENIEQADALSESGAEEFITRLALKPGARLLDVACGNGNLAIVAARIGASVTGVDIAQNLLEQGRERAKSEGLVIQFDEGDVEQLPRLKPGLIPLPLWCSSGEN